MINALTEQGFSPQSASQIEADLIADYRSIPGLEDITTTGDSAIGQIIALQAEREFKIQQLALAVWQSAFRDTATGQSLDNVGANFLKSRRLAARSTVVLTLYNRTSNTSVTVDAFSQVRQSTTGVVFETTESVIIPALQPGETETSVTVNAQSVNTGPFEASIGSINTIVTPVSGWDAVTNESVAIVGRNLETPAEFRIRMAQELAVAQGSTVTAIRAKLMQVPGVTFVSADENRTAFVDVDGNLPHSYRFTVAGGDDADIIETIALAGAGAIATNGSVSGSYTYDNGDTINVFFDRVTEINPYIIVNLTVNPLYPANGDALIADALGMMQFVNGEDLLNYKLIGAIANSGIPGIVDVEVLQGLTPNPTTSDNIVIPASEVLNITADRVTVNS